MDNAPIRVILADDQVLFVESLRRVIEALDPSILIVAVAYNGKEAVERALSLRPDIVILDVRMPLMDGVKAAKLIHEGNPKSKLIMLTTFDDEDYFYKALTQGAVGYLLKDIQPQKLVDAIRAVASGSVLMAEAIATKVIGTAAAHKIERMEAPRPTTDSRPEWYGELSYREREVASLLARGMDNREIAGSMFLAEQTVRNHVSAIYTKLDAKDRVKLIEKLRPFFGKPSVK
jgi:DNA-binding NarL/FixJ family response regulator